MFTTHQFTANGPIHFTINDGRDTLPACGSKVRFGLPFPTQHEVTCKKCQKL